MDGGREKKGGLGVTGCQCIPTCLFSSTNMREKKCCFYTCILMSCKYVCILIMGVTMTGVEYLYIALLTQKPQ